MNQRVICNFAAKIVLCGTAVANLVAGASLLAQSRIHVGANVQVSTDNAELPQDEVWIGADPGDAKHLIGCTIFANPADADRANLVYGSYDGGTTWHETLRKGEGDPACAYGLNGTALYSTALLGNYRLGKPDDPSWTVYFSPDGGKRWEQAHFKGKGNHIGDRAFIAADFTSSPYRGRVYLSGYESIKRMDGEKQQAMVLYRSLDGGKTFEIPAVSLAAESRDDAHIFHQACNLAVLPDGTVAVLVERADMSKENQHDAGRAGAQPVEDGELKLLLSHDGGESFERAISIVGIYQDRREYEDVIPGFLAADPGSAALSNHLYVVWVDGRYGRDQIMFTSSGDGGKKWSTPVVISDDLSSTANHTQPMIAVNAAGVIGVSWYDRRDNPDNKGYYVRFAASLDGGETWLPSERVSSAPKTIGKPGEQVTIILGRNEPSNTPGDVPVTVYVREYEWPTGGHTAGLAADSENKFHVMWVDNRTGVHQIWTAAITVDGQATNPDAVLNGMEEVSKRVSLQFTKSSFDAARSEVSFDVAIKNTSKEALSGPLKVHVMAERSERGVPVLLNTEAGSIVDFSSLMDGDRLAPDQQTKPRRFVFRIDHMTPLLHGDDMKDLLVYFQARTYAGGAAAEK
jgi:hypothetical protein